MSKIGAKTQKQSKGTWGGAREGAGRPKTSPFVAHDRRPTIEGRRCPVKITLRVRSGFPSLREAVLFEAFHQGALRARRFGLRIIHYAIETKRAVFLCEFKDRKSLEKSFKSLNTTLAVALKKAYLENERKKHSGPVFLGRFMMERLESAEAVRAALIDILIGSRAFDDLSAPSTSGDIVNEHREEHDSKRRHAFSSAIVFSAWSKLFDGADKLRRENSKDWPEKWLKEASDTELQQARRVATEITASPQFFLSREGWMRGSVPARNRALKEVDAP